MLVLVGVIVVGEVELRCAGRLMGKERRWRVKISELMLFEMKAFLRVNSEISLT